MVGRTPEQRLRLEREKLGIDHAIVGGVLARRWNLPRQDGGGDRAPSRRRLRRPLGSDRDRRHARPLRPGRGGCPRSPRGCRGSLRDRRRAAARASLRASLSAPGRAPGQRAVPALDPRARRPRRLPRARSTSSSPARCSSRSRRSVPTCTMSTARSVPSTARRRSSRPTTAAGSKPPRRRRYSIRLSRRPIATAWVRLRASSRARMFLVWVRTVSSLT